MSFPYPLFPLSASFGFESAFDYGNGDLMLMNSGAVVSGPVRERAQRKFSFSYAIRDLSAAAAIADILHDLRINAYPVLIRDWADYQVTLMSFAIGDGTSAAKPLYRWYGSLRPVARLIKYPEPDDLVVYENGVEKAIASVDADGVVPVTPWAEYATLSWSGTFYVPVRLQTAGSIKVSGPQGRYAELPQLAAIEDLAA